MPNLDIQILLLDDHVLFRESLAGLLDSEPGFHIVSQCSTVEAALAHLKTTLVHAVLVDLDLGHQRGLQFVRLAAAQGYAGKSLVVTAGVGVADADELIAAGVAGIFVKQRSAESLAQEVRKRDGGARVMLSPVLDPFESLHSRIDQPYG